MAASEIALKDIPSQYNALHTVKICNKNAKHNQACWKTLTQNRHWNSIAKMQN